MNLSFSSSFSSAHYPSSSSFSLSSSMNFPSYSFALSFSPFPFLLPLPSSSLSTSQPQFIFFTTFIHPFTYSSSPFHVFLHLLFTTRPSPPPATSVTHLSIPLPLLLPATASPAATSTAPRDNTHPTSKGTGMKEVIKSRCYFPKTEDRTMTLSYGEPDSAKTKYSNPHLFSTHYKNKIKS